MVYTFTILPPEIKEGPVGNRSETSPTANFFYDLVLSDSNLSVQPGKNGIKFASLQKLEVAKSTNR